MAPPRSLAATTGRQLISPESALARTEMQRHRPHRHARRPRLARRAPLRGASTGVRRAVSSPAPCPAGKSGLPLLADSAEVIAPADTRRLLGLAISASTNAPAEPQRYGVFRR